MFVIVQANIVVTLSEKKTSELSRSVNIDGSVFSYYRYKPILSIIFNIMTDNY